jgi:hypothetical protein
MEATTAQPTAPQPRRVPWLPLFAFFILVVYPLSIGPAYRFARNVTPSSTLNTIYSPLLQIARHSKTARNLLDWYVTTIWKA